ncbi:hypothetical protein CKO51_23310 [Rhodopirellula sp. SM50]|nr:hypothetical protein [Rhodopirellula sp. SM50]PAY17096.1 hypothetical protein CKO51_23310 [Rhodopirellula sp. SM50]
MLQKANSAAVPVKALISPRIDAICGGGLSLVIALVVIAYGSISSSGMDNMLIAVNAYLFSDLLINGPHFMASYRVLYSRRKNFRQHPMVTIGAPVLALAFLVYIAFWSLQEGSSSVEQMQGRQPTGMIVLGWLAPVLLGWHYVGQSWGATACFAHLAGFKMTARDRRLIRCGFYALFVYHVTWGVESMGLLTSWLPQQRAGEFLMESLMQICRVVVLVCFLLGLWGFRLMSVEQGRAVPATVWLPWVATFSWYVMVDIYPQSFFLLQIFHAVQYLMFPARVEMNARGNTRRMKLHMLIYYAALVMIGFVVFEWTQILGWTMSTVSVPFLFLGTATMMIVNVHHYFIDAVIWKIRDPEIRRSVFGHLETS